VSRKRLGILISGRGSNMEALLKAALDLAWPAEPVVVISNRPGAGGLATAESYGVKAFAIDHRPYGKDREAFERDLDLWLRREDVELVALAGFMRVLTPWFVTAWDGKLINIHPSLLPKYPGVDTHEKALAGGDQVHGCSVHFVTAGVDEGPVIGRAEVDVKPDDTADTLAARVLKAEHLLYPRCIAAVAAGWDGLTQFERLEVGGDTVRITAPR
jgi:phosphoribosylglycinamide formyltransferase 1